MKQEKIFLDNKQNEHFKKYGVYTDSNSKIAGWMQEYADGVVKGLTYDVNDELILSDKDAEVFFNEILNPKEANNALKKINKNK